MSPFFSCITVTADDPFYLWLLFSPSSSSSRLFTHPSSTDPSFETPSELVSLPFQLNPSTRSSDSTSAYSHLPPLSQQDAQLPQGFRALPSTDVIDVTKLAPQDLPPPAYENVDERPSSSFSRPSALTARASRPLPVPPLDRLSNSPSVPSVSSATGAVSAEPVNPALHSSPPNCIDPVLSAGDHSPRQALHNCLLHPLESCIPLIRLPLVTGWADILPASHHHPLKVRSIPCHVG